MVGGRAHRMMCTVSTKCQSRFRRTVTTAAPLPSMLIPACFARNMSDCNRVFTTSNGLVTIAPHMPPTLRIHTYTLATFLQLCALCMLTRQQRNGAMTLLAANWILKGLVLDVNERRPSLKRN